MNKRYLGSESVKEKKVKTPKEKGSKQKSPKIGAPIPLITSSAVWTSKAKATQPSIGKMTLKTRRSQK